MKVLSFLRKIYKKQVPQVKSVSVEDPSDFAATAQKILIEKRNIQRTKKFDELFKLYNEKLTDLINIYFKHYSLDDEENTESFNVLNKQWKEMVAKASVSAKNVIVLDKEGFEKAIKNVVSSKKFQDTLSESKLKLENQ